MQKGEFKIKLDGDVVTLTYDLKDMKVSGIALILLKIEEAKYKLMRTYLDDPNLMSSEFTEYD